MSLFSGVHTSIRAPALFIIFFLVAFVAVVNTALTAEAVGESVFTDGEIIDLARPGAVRIIMHAQGTAVYRPFFIDLNTLSPYTNPERDSVRIPFDEYVVGSGALVSSDGHILTLSGTAGRAGTKMKVVSGIARRVLEDELRQLDGASLAEFERTTSTEKNRVLMRMLLSRVEFLDVTEDVRVVSPERSEGEVPEIFENAVPARVIHEGESSGEEYDAYVVLKIEKENLPALPLANISMETSGRNDAAETALYAFQFGDPERNKKSRILALELKRGTLYPDGQSDVLKTSLTLNDSSRSGPIFDDVGTVRGLVSLPMLAAYRSVEGGEVFLVPIALAQSALEAAGVRAEAGEYYIHLLSGIEHLHERSCDRAIQSFAEAKEMAGDFVSGNAVDSYIHTCSQLIGRGNSLDTLWDSFTEFLGRLGPSIWLLIFGALVTVLLIASVALHLQKEEVPQPSREKFPFGLRPMLRGSSGSAVLTPHKGESEEARLEKGKTVEPKVTRENGDTGAPQEIATLGADKIGRYVTNMKNAGMSEDAIIEQLHRIGFSQEQIYEAVVKPHFSAR